jgi:toxin YoeB
MLKEMLRGAPSKGIGKPEPLKHNLSGLWSRRLSQKDRLIYKFDDNAFMLSRLAGIMIVSKSSYLGKFWRMEV